MNTQSFIQRAGSPNFHNRRSSTCGREGGLSPVFYPLCLRRQRYRSPAVMEIQPFQDFRLRGHKFSGREDKIYPREGKTLGCEGKTYPCKGKTLGREGKTYPREGKTLGREGKTYPREGKTLGRDDKFYPRKGKTLSTRYTIHDAIARREKAMPFLYHPNEHRAPRTLCPAYPLF